VNSLHDEHVNMFIMASPSTLALRAAGGEVRAHCFQSRCRCTEVTSQRSKALVDSLPLKLRRRMRRHKP
jgi:hypothetical protein